MTTVRIRAGLSFFFKYFGGKKIINNLKQLISNLFRGKASLSNQYRGRKISLDNKEYTIFRCLKVDGKKDEGQRAIFKVKFKFKNLPLNVNKRLSAIPVPFLISIKEFREKYWTTSKEGYFQGIYQWESEKAAKNYPNTFIYKLMTKRAAPGTVQYEVIPNTELSDYIEKHIKKSDMKQYQ